MTFINERCPKMCYINLRNGCRSVYVMAGLVSAIHVFDLTRVPSGGFPASKVPELSQKSTLETAGEFRARPRAIRISSFGWMAVRRKIISSSLVLPAGPRFAGVAEAPPAVLLWAAWSVMCIAPAPWLRELPRNSDMARSFTSMENGKMKVGTSNRW